jgi:transposase
MNEITTLAIDLAKNVFQVHGVDAGGHALLRKQLRRTELQRLLISVPSCKVAMEACGSAHYWARVAARAGHQVHLIPPQYVKAFNRGQKNDRNDAQAIADASRIPDMARVAVKSEEQQAILALHRLRERVVKERTAIGNQLQSVLGEFGLLIPRARTKMGPALAAVLDGEQLPALLRPAIRGHWEHLLEIEQRLKQLTTQIERLAQLSVPCQRLMQRPGVGPIVATAFAAEVADAATFRNGRQVAAWLGLVPRQYSSGATHRLLGITKRGNQYLRRLLIHGARSAMQAAHRHPERPLYRWGLEVRARRGANRANVAFANKMARHLWASLRYETA